MRRIKREQVIPEFRHAGNFFEFEPDSDGGYIAWGTTVFRVDYETQRSGERIFLYRPDSEHKGFAWRCGRYVVFKFPANRRAPVKYLFLDLKTRRGVVGI